MRSAAGTPDEHAGLFHQTLVEHIANRDSEAIYNAHRAIITKMEALAPAGAGSTDLADPIQRYAFEREAEHLWALGETGQALEVLAQRNSPVPRDNLNRWLPWKQKVESQLGPDHPDTLTTRNNIASWTGDERAALRLFQALLPDYERILGPEHPETLTVRNDIAGWTGRT